MSAVTNIWYGALVNAEWVDVTHGGKLAQLRSGLRLFGKARRHDQIITSEGRTGPIGVVVLLLLLVATRQRKLVLMEFLPGTKRGLGRLVRLVYRAALHRACLGIQVMTAPEREQYTSEYNIPLGLLKVIPFYFVDDGVVPEPDTAPRHGVLSSGRQSCDWDTLIDSVLGQHWDVTMVCSRTAAVRYGSRATSAGIRVLVDIPLEEHDDLLATAALYVLPLTTSSVSSGQTRLMSAMSYRTPTIASEVVGIAGYERLATRLVPAGNAQALREAIAGALGDQGSLRAEMRVASSLALTRTRSIYTAEVETFLRGTIRR